MFYSKHIDVVLNDKVCLIHCPMSNKEMNEHYTVSYLGNVMGGDAISYGNVEIEIMKRAAAKSIKAGEAVWFGCDVGKMFHRDLGVMDMIFSLAPWLLILFFWFFMMRKMQGGGGQGGIFNFVKNKAKMVSPENSKTSFTR